MRYRRRPYPGQAYFFTVVTAGRRPVFADPTQVSLLRSVIAEVRRKRPFIVYAAVILPDHLHMIWRMPEEDGDYPRRWMLIKRAFSMRCGLDDIRTMSQERRGQRGIWQNRYWEHMIRDDDDMARHVDYIHLNPVKHGLCAEPGDWPWSSYRRFVAAGWYGEEWQSPTDPMPNGPE